jgi:hypothetical protein
MPSTDRKLELKAKTSMAQSASQAAVYAKGIRADSHTPWRPPAVLLPFPCRGLERSLSERHIRGVAGERHVRACQDL